VRGKGAVVLCGGRSTRMGRDKAALPFGPETMLERIVRIVRSEVATVVCVGRTGESAERDVRMVSDPVRGLGPLAGIAAGLQSTAAEYVFVVSCDLPLLRPAVIRRLFDLADGFDAGVPVIDGHEMPTCAVYHRRVAAVAARLLAQGQLRATGLVDAVRARLVTEAELEDLDPDLESFLDCNTPERYATALRLAGFDPDNA
jgi:molybdenum cofactor guanylyltransferase